MALKRRIITYHPAVVPRRQVFDVLLTLCLVASMAILLAVMLQAMRTGFAGGPFDAISLVRWPSASFSVPFAQGFLGILGSPGPPVYYARWLLPAWGPR